MFLHQTRHRLLLTAAFLAPLISPSTTLGGTLVFKDDFSAYAAGSSSVNLNLPASDGVTLPTTKIRQSGTVGAWRYSGIQGNVQMGNISTNAGQAGAPSYADYLLIAYNSQLYCDLPLNETMAKGQPVSISFDLGTALPPGYTDQTWWFAFRLGAAGSAYPVLSGDAGFAFLQRINKGVQVFTTGSSGTSDFTGLTDRHFTMVLTDTAGTGSPFAGNGTRVALYNGTTRLGTFDTAQLTQAYMNFTTNSAFASVDNLTVETGMPGFLDNAFHVTQSTFDPGSGQLAMSWTSEAGKTYQITHSPTLAGPWAPVGPQIDATGATTSATVNYDPTVSADFYRAEVVPLAPLVFDGTQVKQDTLNKKLILSDSTGALQLRLSYAGKAVFDRVQVNGLETISTATGACTGIQVGGNWVTTRTLATDPTVTVSGNDVTLSNINYSSGGVSVQETWLLHTGATGVDWTITRQYLSGGTVQDTYFPGWDFANPNTWNAAMLDTGGVAWSRFIGSGSSYGEHSASAKFWKNSNGLNVTVTPGSGLFTASRFSNQPSGQFTFAQSVTNQELTTANSLRRSISGNTLWSPFTATSSSTLQTKLSLAAVNADTQRSRGTFPGIDGASVQDVMDTIGRYGVIDKKLIGGNGWLSGFICLHEPFFGEMGLAIGGADFTANLETSLNDWRDHALQASGRVYARWCHQAGGDNMVPNTYNAYGYYESGWGTLLDTQTCYAINVSEAFDLNGDLTWLQGQKEPTERALNWLLARDSDNDGLVEALTDSEASGKSSDWIDIVWASGENALVNAQLYYALTLWSEREDLLGDSAHATTYRNAAAKLKAAYIKPTTQGGFWDVTNGCFDYWRDKDGSMHGSNLVTPVNFCAIAYGLATSDQATQVLGTMETKMRAQNLFHWPLCFTSFTAAEGGGQGGAAFPNYENGDIFLSWGEVALRSYAAYNPSIAVDYVNRLLTQYKKDGLSYQRYLRNSQTGAGDDILAGNSMTIVGLFRDIYGIRPQWNRFMLDPHLIPSLEGTQLNYTLRGQKYNITVGAASSTVAVDGFSTTSATPYAVNSAASQVSWYSSLAPGTPALTIARDSLATPVTLSIDAWTAPGPFQWMETNASASASLHTVAGLTPGSSYVVKLDGSAMTTVTADGTGAITFTPAVSTSIHAFSVEAAGS